MSDLYPRDSHVTDPDEIHRLDASARKVLARLQQGRATRRELAEIALNVTARISDLRKAGYNPVCIEHRTSGRSVYELQGTPLLRGHDTGYHQ